MGRSSPKIFVQIPSYRDKELVSTIESLLANAGDASRCQISILWQRTKTEEIPRCIRRLSHVEIIEVPFRKSRGANWARRLLQERWHGEPYSLLVDSHTRFTKHWDRKLIAMMKKLERDGIQKPVISGFPPPFQKSAGTSETRSKYPHKMYPLGYDRDILTKFTALPIPLFSWLEDPIPAGFIAMGFLFAHGTFNAQIPFDPEIYFFGDDITAGLRAFTHGFDFFHPHRPIVWHLYDRSSRKTHWSDHSNWRELEEHSFVRVRRTLKGESLPGYEIGKDRSLKDYEEHIGWKLVRSHR